MSKNILIAAVIISIAGCNSGNPIVPTQNAPKYFPLAAGNTWMYDNTTKYSGRDTTVPLNVDLEGPVEYNGLKWFGANDICVERITMSPLPLFCAMWARDGNRILSQQNGPGPVFPHYEVILDFPLYVGKTCMNKSLDTVYVIGTDTVHELARVKREIVGIETVTTPAGLFINSVHIVDSTIEAEYSSSSIPIGTYHRGIANEWYAENVGMVKQTTWDVFGGDPPQPPQSMKRELRSYSVKVSN